MPPRVLGRLALAAHARAGRRALRRARDDAGRDAASSIGLTASPSPATLRRAWSTAAARRPRPFQPLAGDHHEQDLPHRTRGVRHRVRRAGRGPGTTGTKPIQTVPVVAPAAPQKTAACSQQDKMRECNKQATGKKGAGPPGVHEDLPVEEEGLTRGTSRRVPGEPAKAAWRVMAACIRVSPAAQPGYATDGEPDDEPGGAAREDHRDDAGLVAEQRERRGGADRQCDGIEPPSARCPLRRRSIPSARTRARRRTARDSRSRRPPRR